MQTVVVVIIDTNDNLFDDRTGEQIPKNSTAKYVGEWVHNVLTGEDDYAWHAVNQVWTYAAAHPVTEAQYK